MIVIVIYSWDGHSLVIIIIIIIIILMVIVYK